MRATEYIVRWVGSDVPDTPVLEKRTPDAALSELIDDWNDNHGYERLGEDRNMLESRRSYEVSVDASSTCDLNGLEDQREETRVEENGDGDKVYRVKGCPHCGAEPVLFRIGGYYALDCNQHRDFDVCAMAAIFPDEATIEGLIKIWNDDHHYHMLEANQSILESRQFYEVPLNPYPKPAKAKRSGRPTKGKNRPASAAEASR
ncbi:hypothetical protein [Paracidovorax valerianellae]|uniref:hypothetical protein n=1 Tax=Paracidovorax valerianellae TaxID=187868 RepID=UPI0011141EED|nr:hypothetical protein [Paracidovorax valerianellae]MDA8443619.1 hypothetical protein [Paracidovorax valerianellae]